MSKSGRVLSVALGCLGVLTFAAGTWYWWFLDLVTATDRGPFEQARALIIVGGLLFVAAAVLWRRSSA